MSDYRLLDIFNTTANYRNSQYAECPSKQNLPRLTSLYERANWQCFAKKYIHHNCCNSGDHTWPTTFFDGSVQDCGISIANALELLQYCTKPAICVSPGMNMLKAIRFPIITWLGRFCKAMWSKIRCQADAYVTWTTFWSRSIPMNRWNCATYSCVWVVMSDIMRVKTQSRSRLKHLILKWNIMFFHIFLRIESKHCCV